VLLGERGLLEASTLIGIDCRSAAIQRAAAGRYPRSALEPVPAALRARWFEADGDGVRVAAELSDRATWLVADALALRGAAGADLVMCRNVAIYLRPDAAERLWQRVAACVRPGGLLLVGKAERPPATTSLERVAPCLYRKALT
jgi:chemotaxis protein methyltransferase CheR